jgi:hypothetical protein
LADVVTLRSKLCAAIAIAPLNSALQSRLRGALHCVRHTDEVTVAGKRLTSNAAFQIGFGSLRVAQWASGEAVVSNSISLFANISKILKNPYRSLSRE